MNKLVEELAKMAALKAAAYPSEVHLEELYFLRSKQGKTVLTTSSYWREDGTNALHQNNEYAEAAYNFDFAAALRATAASVVGSGPENTRLQGLLMASVLMLHDAGHHQTANDLDAQTSSILALSPSPVATEGAGQPDLRRLFDDDGALLLPTNIKDLPEPSEAEKTELINKAVAAAGHCLLTAFFVCKIPNYITGSFSDGFGEEYELTFRRRASPVVPVMPALPQPQKGGQPNA